MIEEERTGGIVLLCDREGTIIQVVQNTLGHSEVLVSGAFFNTVVDRGSFKKTLHFMHELRSKGSIFDWQFNMTVGGELLPLSFGGFAMDDGLIIIGARSQASVSKIHEELLRINNEQMNMLRSTMKERTDVTRHHVDDHALYGEFSQLNNELATLQRELAQKNALLERQQIELEAKNTLLYNLNASKDRFFSIISHDLRSPFNALLGFAHLLSVNADRYTSEQVKEKAVKMESLTEKIYALLENLLAWSRLQHGAMPYDPRMLHLREMVEDMCVLFISQTEQKEISLIESIPEDMQIWADENMLNTILRNLVSNALKFTENGGMIEISARPCDTGIEIAVSDTGAGIREEDVPKLFQIDEQYTTLGTAGEKGTGLGLHLCKELMQRQGGTISMESHVGQGTTFRLHLPLYQEET